MVFRVRGSGFWVGLGFRVKEIGFRVHGNRE